MKMTYPLLMWLAVAGSMKSCAVTYQGQYGTYTGTSDGEITITPHYAK